MAANPLCITTTKTGLGIVTTATTDKTGATTTNIKDVYTGAAAPGSQILRVRWAADTNLGDGTLLLWIHDGTAYRLFDDIDVGDPAAASNTVAGFTFEKAYSDLYLQDGNYKLAAGCTVITGGSLYVWAFGGTLS